METSATNTMSSTHFPSLVLLYPISPKGFITLKKSMREVVLTDKDFRDFENFFLKADRFFPKRYGIFRE